MKKSIVILFSILLLSTAVGVIKNATKQEDLLVVEIMVSENNPALENTRYFKIKETWTKVDSKYKVKFSEIESIKESNFDNVSKPSDFEFKNREIKVYHRIVRNDGVPMAVLYPKD